MNKYLHQLVDLSQIDQEIDSFEPKIAAITKALKDSNSKIEKINHEIASLDAQKKELSQDIAQTHTHIDEFSAKLKESAKKSASVKSEKEANALKIEEDIIKEQLEAANEEIIRLEKILDSKQDHQKELETRKQEEEAKLEGISKDVGEQVKVLEQERSIIYEKKNELTSQMNPKILGFYEKIRKWAKNTAVVPVKKQACYGCFMKIYDKTYLAVQKGDEIATCPHCGRILYMLKDAQEPEEASEKSADKPAKKASEKKSTKSAKTSEKKAK